VVVRSSKGIVLVAAPTLAAFELGCRLRFGLLIRLGLGHGLFAGMDGGGVATDVTGDLLSIVAFARASLMCIILPF
jgi:hypothetical protein